MYVQALLMKKNRPGFLITCLMDPDAVSSAIHFLGTETSTTGIRYRTEWRTVLPRRIISVSTRFGEILVKVSGTGACRKIAPEYESCRSAALKHQAPLQDVYREAVARTLAIVEEGD